MMNFSCDPKAMNSHDTQNSRNHSCEQVVDQDKVEDFIKTLSQSETVYALNTLGLKTTGFTNERASRLFRCLTGDYTQSDFAPVPGVRNPQTLDRHRATLRATYLDIWNLTCVDEQKQDNLDIDADSIQSEDSTSVSSCRRVVGEGGSSYLIAPSDSKTHPTDYTTQSDVLEGFILSLSEENLTGSLEILDLKTTGSKTEKVQRVMNCLTGKYLPLDFVSVPFLCNPVDLERYRAVRRMRFLNSIAPIFQVKIGRHSIPRDSRTHVIPHVHERIEVVTVEEVKPTANQTEVPTDLLLDFSSPESQAWLDNASTSDNYNPTRSNSEDASVVNSHDRLSWPMDEQQSVETSDILVKYTSGGDQSNCADGSLLVEQQLVDSSDISEKSTSGKNQSNLTDNSSDTDHSLMQGQSSILKCTCQAAETTSCSNASCESSAAIAMLTQQIESLTNLVESLINSGGCLTCKSRDDKNNRTKSKRVKKRRQKNNCDNKTHVATSNNRKSVCTSSIERNKDSHKNHQADKSERRQVIKDQPKATFDRGKQQMVRSDHDGRSSLNSLQKALPKKKLNCKGRPESSNSPSDICSSQKSRSQTCEQGKNVRSRSTYDARNEDKGANLRIQDAPSSQTFRWNCWNCDVKGHRARVCPAPHVLKCYKCKFMGYKRTNCPRCLHHEEFSTMTSGCESSSSEFRSLGSILLQKRQPYDQQNEDGGMISTADDKVLEILPENGLKTSEIVSDSNKSKSVDVQETSIPAVLTKPKAEIIFPVSTKSVQA